MALRCVSTGLKSIAFKNAYKFSSLAIDQTISVRLTDYLQIIKLFNAHHLTAICVCC
jgi:hypothetical protein